MGVRLLIVDWVLSGDQIAALASGATIEVGSPRDCRSDTTSPQMASTSRPRTDREVFDGQMGERETVSHET